MCGNYCYPYEGEDASPEDQKAFLEEREKILEAKLATIKHLKANLGKNTDEE